MALTEVSAPTTVEMSEFANSVYEGKYAWRDADGNVCETWEDTAYRVATNVLGAIGLGPEHEYTVKVYELIRDRKFMPGGRYLYASGRDLHQVQNCLLMRAEDTREGWADLLSKSAMALQTGAGIGIDYSEVRPSGTPIKRTGGVASGPLALMQMVNEIGRGVMQGGARRSAIWAGLNWKHSDIFAFINMKNWSDDVKALKARDFSFPATMDFTNISVLLDDEFFVAYENEDHDYHGHAVKVYRDTVANALITAEPGFSVDTGENAGETLRNACTEITSRDDSDVCNLGSLNLGAFEEKYEFADAVMYATLFLLAGTVYSHLPYDKVEETREKNRRLGLGLMGVHEWLLVRGKKYGPDQELGDWLECYKLSTNFANQFAEMFGLSRPVKTRAIAPTGTIGIVAETTTGCEPIFCAAYKRRVREAATDGHDKVTYQYVVDPTAKKLIARGVDPNAIEDAYTLSYDVERRIEFQAWLQKYVDHAISSTINLPYVIEDYAEVGQFGDTLMEYLPQLRGVTVYPDGARSGQPITPCGLQQALDNEGTVFEEELERCVGGMCGS